MKEWSERQKVIFDVYEKTNKNIVVEATAGCLGLNTPVLMYDGSIKPVQDIKVGDQVMGPDSTSRTVLQLHRGQSELYEIIPTKGDSWICNKEHIMTVWDEYIYQNIRRYENTSHKTALVDYSLEKVLSRKLNPKGNVSYMFLQRGCIDFPEKELPIEPYFLGLWLGDGTKSKYKCQLSVNCKDKEILDYLDHFQLNGKNKLILKKTKQKGNCYYCDFHTLETGKDSNPLYPILRECLREEDFYIPEKYYINSRENRLELLAGILDSDGWLCNIEREGNSYSGYFEIATKYESFKENILYLCRSLGLAAYSKKSIRRIKERNFAGEYYIITISGDLSIIPTKLPRKQAFPRKQRKSVLRTGFAVKSIGRGDYYGFTVDKDERFLLGDFTITHNSGKTTTIVELCKRTPVYKKCFFSAFNKSIAEELSSRLPERIDVSTFHSKGLKTLLKNFRFKLKVNENKCFKIGKQILTLDDIPEKQQLKYLFDLQTIWNSIRLGLLVDYEQDIPNICVEKDLDFKPRMVEDVRSIEEEWLKRAKFINNGRDFEVDFTDMLYLPYILLKSEDFSKYDVVVVDECQDLCTLQKELIFNYIKPLGGRLICVGDSKQCIYSFIGSSVSNFKQLQNLDNTITLPLDVTYRCARSVVEEAKKVFSQGIEAAENAIEGIVRKGNLEEARTGDFVLCRNNLPLIDAFIILLQKGIKASIKDKDFGKSLLNILEKISRIEDLDILMNDKLEELKERGLSKTAAMNNASYLSLVEKCSILERLSNIWTSIEVMRSKIEKIYTEDEKDGVILSTIHKSKGLESDRVFFLNPNLIPSPKVTCEEALYSEYCLKFVAITRAKKELIYCNV